MRISSIVLTLNLSLGALAGADVPFAERDSRYELQPTDVVEVRFALTPQFNQTVEIQPDGYVSLDFGEVEIGGLTLPEAREAIVTLSSTRLRDPIVQVSLKDYERPHYIVGGEVAAPGRYPLRGDISAYAAISMAGGFKPSAKHSQVLLVRRLDDEVGRVMKLDLKRMRKHPEKAEDPLIERGDLLIVPQSPFSKIARIVQLANFGVFWSLNVRDAPTPDY